MKRRPMIPWFSVACVNMSSKAKRRTHYDNLEVNPRATQSEIKAAYFKLTMQYHPDKNNSEEAKVKFRDIAEAYEVLGSYDKRRHYDRGLQIRTPVNDKPESMTKTMETNITKEAERARNEIFRHVTQSDGKPIFNFDAWTEAHYGKVFERRRRENVQYKVFMNAREEANKSHVKESVEFSALTIFALTMFIFLILRLQLWHNLDEPQLIAKEEKISSSDDKSAQRNPNISS